jgi:hypothetical protein
LEILHIKLAIFIGQAESIGLLLDQGSFPFRFIGPQAMVDMGYDQGESMGSTAGIQQMKENH